MTRNELIAYLEKLPEDEVLIGVWWSGEDIRHQANKDNVSLSEEQVGEVADYLEHKFDANIGINWDTISCAIEAYN